MRKIVKWLYLNGWINPWDIILSTMTLLLLAIVLILLGISGNFEKLGEILGN